MKKFIVTLAIFIAAYSSNAQEIAPLQDIKTEGANLTEFAERDAQFIANHLNLDVSKTKDLTRLFVYKYKELTQETTHSSIEKLHQSITERLRTLLSSEQYASLASIDGAILKLGGLIYLNPEIN